LPTERPKGLSRFYKPMSIANSLLYLAEHSSELYFIYDLLEKRFTYMNATCLSFFDLKDTEVSPENLLQMIHPDDRDYILNKFESCIAGQQLADIEFRVIRREHERWLKINTHSAAEDGQRLFIGHAEDFTAYKTNTEIINNHTQKKNSILNILAHDLAGPLGTISNLTTLLARETGHLQNQKINRYLEMITSISKSGIKLVQDFLDQEFLESISIRLLKKRVDLVDKVKISTIKYFEMQEDIQIEFSFHANREVIFVEIDEDKFMQVLNNLISNALKFTPDGGKISVAVLEGDTDVILSVEDTGVGIPEEYRATLFDKFSNARRLGLKGEQSTGLGMSIIKTIVEWHQGKIWFESEVNKGTTFYVQLPKT
jgi:two-component system sensor histidine kinase VicK